MGTKIKQFILQRLASILVTLLGTKLHSSMATLSCTLPWLCSSIWTRVNYRLWICLCSDGNLPCVEIKYTSAAVHREEQAVASARNNNSWESPRLYIVIGYSYFYNFRPGFAEKPGCNATCDCPGSLRCLFLADLERNTRNIFFS